MPPHCAPPTVAGILGGAFLLGLHMAATHGVSVAMLSSYIPAQPVPGLGRLSGTAWALTDLLLGELRQGCLSDVAALFSTHAASGGASTAWLSGASTAWLSGTAWILADLLLGEWCC